MINLKSLSTPLCKFSFNFTSFSWSNSATRSSITVFTSMKSMNPQPRLLRLSETIKIIDEGQVIRYCKSNSAMFPGSSFLLSPLSSWKLNQNLSRSQTVWFMRTISPQYKMAYKSLTNDEEKFGISEVMGYATTEEKMSTALNKLLLLQTSKMYEGVITAGRYWTKDGRVFIVSPYSPVIVSLSATNSHLGASRGYISQDVNFIKAISQVYEMDYKRMDNEAIKVRFSELWEDAVEEGKMYCSCCNILRIILEIIDAIDIYDEGTDMDNILGDNVDTDSNVDQPRDNETRDEGVNTDDRGTTTNPNDDHGTNANESADGDNHDGDASDQEEEDNNDHHRNNDSEETLISDHHVDDTPTFSYRRPNED